MKCSICKRNKAEIFVNGRAYCKECFLKVYERKVERIVKRWKLINKGERVIVALSGGKDSSSAAQVLAKLREKMGFELSALFIDLGIPTFSELSKASVVKLTKKLGIELHVVELKKEVGKTLPEIAKEQARPICSICGIVKRYYMNRIPRLLGFDKVATGHTMDDVLEFFFKNIAGKNFEWNNKLKPLTLSEHPKLVAKIRPLFECSDEENLVYARLNDLPFYDGKCPFSTVHRWKKALNCFEQQVRGSKLALVKGVEEATFVVQKKKEEYVECKICGELTTSKDGVCSFCKLTRLT